MEISFLSTAGSGGTAAPFFRQNPQQLSSIVHSPADAHRLKRYEESWRFFNGTHWSFVREEGSPLVTANYCRTVVNKKVSWLVGKGMILDTPVALRKITKPVLEKVWRENSQDQKLHELATTGGVTGDVCVLVTAQAPSIMERRLNPYIRGKVRIRLLSPAQCFPTWNPLNMEELVHLRIITEIPVYTQAPFDPRRPASAGMGVMHKRKYVEDIYPDRIEEGWENEQKTSRVNELGEISFVHWPNETFPGEYWGKSDLDDIIDIQREFNEKLTDVSDIVNYHASPVTIITGAKAAQLERGPKSLWSGLPADAKVYNLQMAGDMAVSFKYLEFVRQLILDISNVPEGAFGRIQSISNTSAAALQVQFQPLVEATARKAVNYTTGIQKINYFILRYDQLINNKVYPVDLCRNCGGRIVSFKVIGSDGVERIKRKCYMIDPQTLDFMNPEDVKVSVTIEHSFGNEVRKMPFGWVKKNWGKLHQSYWDPEPMVDKQEKALMQKEHQEAKQEEAMQMQSEMQGQQAEDDHQRQMEQIEAKRPPAKPPTGAK